MSDSLSDAQPAAGPEPLIDVLVQTAFVITGVLNRIAAEHDLSLTQLRVLAILRDRQPQMTGLAGYLGLDRSTMTGLVDRAEKRGLLRRTPNLADGRAVDVALTATGAALTEQLYERVARSLQPMTAGLAPSEQRRLQQLLTQLVSRSGQPSA
jgi:DNA-binding MarR family transcriptional regulator